MIDFLFPFILGGLIGGLIGWAIGVWGSDSEEMIRSRHLNNKN